MIIFDIAQPDICGGNRRSIQLFKRTTRTYNLKSTLTQKNKNDTNILGRLGIPRRGTHRNAQA